MKNVLKFFNFTIFVFASLFSISAWAFNPEISCAQPQSIDAPTSYYARSENVYLLATDSCMVDVFLALGMVAQEKPAGENFANDFTIDFGFPDCSPMSSIDLKIYGCVSDFNPDGALLKKAFGFKTQSNFDVPSGFFKDSLLKWRFRVCNKGTAEDPAYVSCSLLSPAERMNNFY